MAKKLSDTEIANNVRSKLTELTKEVDELYELHQDWNPKKDWHENINKVRTKQYLLQEILGEDE